MTLVRSLGNLGTILGVGLALGCSTPPSASWWKGNLHTHSLWSDGDDFPEMVVAWYRDHGYHFLALSDHNLLAEGERWIDADRAGREVLARYRARFDPGWAGVRGSGDSLEIRLKTLEEFRPLFEEPGRFLLLKSEEITDRFETTPVHLNATNLVSVVAPRGGTSVLDVLQNNVDAVLAQRRETGMPMFPHVNHPNYGWAVTAEDLIALDGERFFEVYNGHPLVNNRGDATHPDTDRLWDIVLAERLARRAPVMYGIAVDDAHQYQRDGRGQANPGRGWIVVRAETLSPGAIVAAMEAGDFYASTGVVLDDVLVEDGRMSLTIAADRDVTYRTQFIGTRRGYDAPVQTASTDPTAPLRFHYGDEIGAVLSEVEGTRPHYTFRGDELYVRAKVVSSRPKANPNAPGEVEVAWTQPVVVGGL
jgi:hypothetical protein